MSDANCICGCEKAKHPFGQCSGIVGFLPCPCIRYRPAPDEIEEMAQVKSAADFDILCWKLCCLHYWPQGLMAYSGDIPESLEHFIPTPPGRVM